VGAALLNESPDDAEAAGETRAETRRELHEARRHNDATRVWVLSSGQLRTLTSHTSPWHTMAYSPDGRYLASDDDATLRVSADTAPTPTVAIDRICRNVHRDLTSEERKTYLSSTGSSEHACPHPPG
jgi:WD40 repeat protein